MYALLGLLALGVLLAFWRALRDRRLRTWAVLVAASAGAYLTHYFALYLPLVEFVFLLATFRRRHRVLVRWTVAQALAILPFAAWVVVLYSSGGGTFGIGWIPRPQLSDPLKTLWSFGMAYDGRVNLVVVGGLLLWVGLLVLGAGHGRGHQEARKLLMLAFALPPLVTFLLSLRRPTYVDRFFIGSLPAFLLLAASGLARLPRPARWAAGLALAGVGLWGATRLHAAPVFVKEDWRGAAAYVEERGAPGDALALRYFQYVVPWRYYYRGTLEPAAVTLNRQTTSLEEIAARHRRLWLIFRARHDDPHHLAWGSAFVFERDETDPIVRAWVSKHPLGSITSFHGVVVMLFDLETVGE